MARLKVLIANRGAIACRILRTLRKMDIGSVAVYSDADRYAVHVELADEAVRLGPAPAAESYLRKDLLVDAARATGANAIHPGYGFLSENAEFAAACEDAGIVFIGPTPKQMREFGLKHTARALAKRCGVPLLPGSDLLRDADEARREAERIGYPVMLKSTAGGGGIGMQLCQDASRIAEAFASVDRLARNNFGGGGLYAEKFVEHARHVEVQIFGDGRGEVIALGERDCSLQRRNQKVVEETPAPGLSSITRERMFAAAVKLAQAVEYRSAGTVEFVYDATTGEFYFLEVNTRLQVEHGVTEAVTGIDLVEWMVRTAMGDPPDLARVSVRPKGHAIQARLYAEDPANDFRPSSGLLSNVALPDGVRVDTWIATGTDVTANYDPMLAKVIATGADRAAAIAALDAALGRARIDGIETNLAYLREVLREPAFAAGEHTTRTLSRFEHRTAAIEVRQPGTHTTVQDFPGRLGYWDVGVPPSGPMDSLAFRLANRIVGNAEEAAGLELTVTGPTLRFRSPTTIALTGARMRADLDGTAVPFWQPVDVPAGATLRLRSIDGAGQRTYLAVRGGLDVPPYLGSRATFTLGGFGGHAGRQLRAGDVLKLVESNGEGVPARAPLAEALRPQYGNEWHIAVTSGPHGAPDFFTDDDIRTFFSTAWKVHYNSSRTGVRLVGPKPQWARSDGGEAGLHPSNIHDNAYAVGTVDFTGDMPVILGPDGPSLGGFVCPATIVLADLWKIGQLRPGDTIRFEAIDVAEAIARQREQDRFVATLETAATATNTRPADGGHGAARVPASPILARLAATDSRPAVCYRQDGEDNLLIEYGPNVLDLELRFRVHALMQWLRERRIDGIVDLTPGIRSLQVHFDGRRIAQSTLLERLARAEEDLPANDDLAVPSRIVHLPLSWDDPATRLAIERYQTSVRPHAPWCPSNIEFIRRINGLDSIDDVKRIVFGASYLVLGLGDVYLGAPVATPLDPRHRLVTTKYNPARTWTPENAVGIGGAYLCVYGMEGPGGYQFVGRTVQMWNRHRVTAQFEAGRPWLLRFFDQIRFHEVSAEELLRLREDFPRGRHTLRIDHSRLAVRDYRAFLRENSGSIAAFKSTQQAAFEAERERWRAAGAMTFVGDADAGDVSDDAASGGDAALTLPPDCTAASSPVTGRVWQMRAQRGARVRAGDELVVVEAMKMEIPVEADQDGEVVELRCSVGGAVSAGDPLVILRPSSP